MSKIKLVFFLVTIFLCGTASISNEIEVYICQPDLTWGFDLDPTSCDVMRIEEASYDVTITSYSSTVDQCDSDPHTTASMTKTHWGVVALSRDFLKKFEEEYKKKNPDHEAPFDWGDQVFIDYGDGFRHGPFYVEDTMAKRKKQQVDVWRRTREEALQYPPQPGRLVVFKKTPTEPLLSSLI
jgi:hypothetical protein